MHDKLLSNIAIFDVQLLKNNQRSYFEWITFNIPKKKSNYPLTVALLLN